MGGEYRPPASGLDGQIKWMRWIERRIDSLASAATILSAVIGKGGVTVKSGGSVAVEDGGGIVVADGGFISAIGGSIRAVHETTGSVMAYFGRLLPPYKSGLMTSTESGAPYFWAAVDESNDRSFYFGGQSARIDADVITLNTPSLRPYGLGSTGIAPNLAMESVGGIPVIKLVTSSERGKTDIAPLEIDIDEVLEYQAITWIHTETLDSSPPGDIRRNVGHHAEAMDSFPSLRQFVNYDEGGEPASVQEGRFEVALHEVMKVVYSRVVQLEKNQAVILAHLGLDPNELGA